MPLPFILLGDGSLIVTHPSGVTTISPTSMNYSNIREALESSVSTSEILALLHVHLPDGIWYAYNFQDALLIHHLKRDLTTSTSIASIDNTSIQALPKHAKLLGTYTSKASLIAAYPEYFL